MDKVARINSLYKIIRFRSRVGSG